MCGWVGKSGGEERKGSPRAPGGLGENCTSGPVKNIHVAGEEL